MKRAVLFALGLLSLAGGATAQSRADHVLVQSTTSTQNSGLFDAILPQFTDATGIEVRVVAVGTGQAIRNARNGDGDVLFVHSSADEAAFVAEGHGVERFDVMYNDFVVIGPATDPARIRGEAKAGQALDRIAGAQAIFVSRGDDSGTHKAELRLWSGTGVDLAAASGGWYRETGSGMGGTLNAAVAMGGYTLTDRATWIAFGNKGDHRILVEGDPALFNQYGVILVDAARHPGVNGAGGQAFVDWLISAPGQAAIGAFRIDGQQLFFPNARGG